MTSKFNVVHISPTPLVAAPAKISKALRLVGVRSVCIALNDYPEKGPLYKKFIDGVLVAKGASAEISRHINESIESADIIHIHNDLPPDFVKKLIALAPHAKYVYQVHSPLKEGPNYIERAEFINLPFERLLVVGQYHPRLYADYLPVPNIILEPPSISKREKGEKLRVMFSPTHARPGRWNAKHSPGLETALESLSKIGKIDLIRPEGALTPDNLISIRRTVHVSVDEIATGAFHQVSMEGMCAGNVVINGADYFSKASLAQLIDSQEMPPFLSASETNIADRLLDLSYSIEKTVELQEQSYDYFCKNLRPEKLVQSFLRVYESIR